MKTTLLTTIDLLYNYTLTKYLLKHPFTKLECFTSGGNKRKILNSLKDAEVILDLSLDYEIVTDDMNSFKIITDDIENDSTVTYIIQFSKIIDCIKRSFYDVGRGYDTNEEKGYMYARNTKSNELFYIWDVCQPEGKIFYNTKNFLKLIFK